MGNSWWESAKQGLSRARDTVYDAAQSVSDAAEGAQYLLKPDKYQRLGDAPASAPAKQPNALDFGKHALYGAGEMLYGMGKSAEMLGRAGNMALNPILALQDPENRQMAASVNQAVRNPGALWQGAKDYVGNRYGSIDNALKTAYDDPVGTAMDAATVLSAGETAIGKGAQLGRALRGGAVADEALTSLGRLRSLPDARKAATLPDDLAAWQQRGRSVPLDDVEGTQAWMREGRGVLDKEHQRLAASIKNEAQKAEAGVRLRNPDAFLPDEAAVEFVESNPLAPGDARWFQNRQVARDTIRDPQALSAFESEMHRHRPKFSDVEMRAAPDNAPSTGMSFEMGGAEDPTLRGTFNVGPNVRAEGLGGQVGHEFSHYDDLVSMGPDEYFLRQAAEKEALPYARRPMEQKGYRTQELTNALDTAPAHAQGPIRPEQHEAIMRGIGEQPRFRSNWQDEQQVQTAMKRLRDSMSSDEGKFALTADEDPAYLQQLIDDAMMGGLEQAQSPHPSVRLAAENARKARQTFDFGHGRD